jgi:flap endonuclease-1
MNSWTLKKCWSGRPIRNSFLDFSLPIYNKSSCFTVSMGIRQLWQTLAKKAPDAFFDDGMARISGMRAFIDVPVFAYAALRILGRDEAVAENVLALAARVHRAGAASCALVFDGTPHALKAEELARRRALSAATVVASSEPPTTLGTTMIITDLDIPLVGMHSSMKPSKATFDCIRAAASGAHFPEGFLECIEAPADAEATCAARAAECGGVVLTSDSDALTFGAPHVLRYLPGGRAYTLVHLEQVLGALNMDLAAFRQWCVMCGSDFCEPISKLGPMTSLKYICDLGGRADDGRDLIGEVLARRTALQDPKMQDPSATVFSSRYKAALDIFTVNSR